MLNKNNSLQPHLRVSLEFECNKTERPTSGEIFYWMKGSNCTGTAQFFEDLNFIYDPLNCLNFYYSRYLGLSKNWHSTSKLLSIIYRWLRISLRNWINVDVTLTSHNGDEHYIFSLSNGRREARLSRLSADFFAWLCIRSFFISFSNPSNISANLSFPTAFDDRRILLTYFFPCTSSLKKKMMKSRWNIDE